MLCSKMAREFFTALRRVSTEIVYPELGGDADDAMALAIYGHAHSNLTKDFDESLGVFDRAIATSPNSAIAWIFKGATLCFVGDGPGATKCAEIGVRLGADLAPGADAADAKRRSIILDLASESPSANSTTSRPLMRE